MKVFKSMTALILALVMAAMLAVSAYAATVVVKYKVYVYTSQLTFKQYDYSSSTTPNTRNLTILADSSLGSGSALYHVKYVNGAVAYCIQPGVRSDDSSNYVQGSSGCWYNLPASVQSGIALALACGYPSAEYGTYYAKGITTKKADATTFVPNAQGHIVVKGLEDDAYSLTEIATDKGYVLLKDAVKIIITTKENGACDKCGAKLLTASATVNGKDATMTDGNAVVPLTVVNNPGFDLPKTGGYGTWMFTIGGMALLGAAAFIAVKSRKHKSEQ